MTQSTHQKPAQGYPLIALFLLVVVAAAMTAQLLILRTCNASSNEVATSLLVYGISGTIYGLIVGLHDFRRARGAVFGPFIGLVTGCLAGPIAIAASEEPWAAITTATGSAVGLVVLTTLYRVFNANDPVR